MLSYAVRAKLTTRTWRSWCRTRSRSGGRCRRSALGRNSTGSARSSTPRGRRCRSSSPAPGLRPEEWLALEWRDIDLKAGVLHVRRVYTDGRVKDYGKQDRSRRRLPLRRRAVDALRASPQGFGSSAGLSGRQGGYLNLHAWRRDEWKPALESAGLPYLVPYSMRHTFASFAIAAGVSLFYLARLMGSSVEQIDKTYGHMLPESRGLPTRAVRRFRRGRSEGASCRDLERVLACASVREYPLSRRSVELGVADVTRRRGKIP